MSVLFQQQWLEIVSEGHHRSLHTNNMTGRQCRDSLPVLSQYFTTGVLLILSAHMFTQSHTQAVYLVTQVYQVNVHSTNIVHIHIIKDITGMTMNNCTLAVSSSPDENHHEMVTDTPSVLPTIRSNNTHACSSMMYNQSQSCGPGSPQFLTSMHTVHTRVHQGHLSFLLACTLYTQEFTRVTSVSYAHCTHKSSPGSPQFLTSMHTAHTIAEKGAQRLESLQY